MGTTHRVVDLGNGAGFLLDYCFFGPESADEAFEFIIRLRAKGSGHGTGATGRACAVAAEFPGPLAREAATDGFAIEVQTAEVVGEIYGTERQVGQDDAFIRPPPCDCSGDVCRLVRIAEVGLVDRFRVEVVKIFIISNFPGR